MIRLLNAGFSRLFRDCSFWLGVYLMLVQSVINMVILSADRGKYPPDLMFFDFLYVMPFLLAVFCVFFISAEKDNYLRNILVCGHSRVSVYLSWLILCAAGCGLMMLAYVIPFTVFGVFFGSGFVREPAMILEYSAAGLANGVCYASLFAALCVIIPDSRFCVVSCIVLAGALTAAIQFLSGAEQNAFEYFAADGSVVMPEKAAANTAVLTLCKILPSTQAAQIRGFRINPAEALLYSAAAAVLAAAAGIAVFRRKDIK